jgi:hypothetical protein
LKILSTHLKKLFKHCVPSPDEFRFHLSALRIEGGKIISTDGHRIHVIPHPEANGTTASVPAWAIRAVLDAVGSGTTTVELEGIRGDLDALVTVPYARIEASIGNASYPPWRQVFPAGDPRSIVEIRKPKALLARLRKLRTHGAECVVLACVIGPDAMTPWIVKLIGVNIVGRKLDALVPVELLRSDVDVQQSKKQRDVGLKTDYLIDALAAAQEYGGETISMELRGELDGVVFRSGGFEACVMPVRI